jgi:hypothetical protein
LGKANAKWIIANNPDGVTIKAKGTEETDQRGRFRNNSNQTTKNLGGFFYFSFEVQAALFIKIDIKNKPLVFFSTLFCFLPIKLDQTA